RVLFTKNKRLIIYAFDLDAQPGVQNASSFQAWGRRGPDKKQALSLGLFYEDNANKKRWVLKANDAKTLEDIDAVFVTVEPNGGSQHPSGKQLLFAYLRVGPNHPRRWHLFRTVLNSRQRKIETKRQVIRIDLVSEE